MKYSFNKNYVWGLTKNILEIDSPSGYTNIVMDNLGVFVNQLGYEFIKTNKGVGVIFIEGRNNSKKIAVSAHLDTLGLMVRSVNSDGTLALTTIGSPILPTLDGEYCTIHTRLGKTFTGTILCDSSAIHVHEDASNKPRKIENLVVRLDEIVHSDSDTKKLEVNSGDFVCINTKTEITENGFIKSRFLDDKLSVGIIFGVLELMATNKLKPQFDTYFLFTNYEEVGHGMSYIPDGISEVLAVDMGCIGLDLNCSEYDVSICAKDSSGPYDFEMTNLLIELAKSNSLKYVVDIYPHYSSDISAARTSGYDIKGALIGSGVHSSHGMERSHYIGVENTMQLLANYLQL